MSTVWTGKAGDFGVSNSWCERCGEEEDKVIHARLTCSDRKSREEG